MGDDGSKVCDMNWDNEQPNMGDSSHVRLYLCANAKTGKWETCKGSTQDTTVKNLVVCENGLERKDCTGSKVNVQDLDLSGTLADLSAEMGDQCIYMGVGKENCHETCWKQSNGLCNAAALSMIDSKDACHTVLQRFDKDIDKDVTHGTIASSYGGCMYEDTAAN